MVPDEVEAMIEGHLGLPPGESSLARVVKKSEFLR